MKLLIIGIGLYDSQTQELLQSTRLDMAYLGNKIRQAEFGKIILISSKAPRAIDAVKIISTVVREPEIIHDDVFFPGEKKSPNLEKVTEFIKNIYKEESVTGNLNEPTVVLLAHPALTRSLSMQFIYKKIAGENHPFFKHIKDLKNKDVLVMDFLIKSISYLPV